jgi:small subunit ribosomal protein S8
MRNARAAHLQQVAFTMPGGSVSLPKNILCILTILRKRGVIRGFTLQEQSVQDKKKRQVILYLKYDAVGKPLIDTLFIVSKPSRRVYISSVALWQPQTSTGFFVLSTSYGILTDNEARRYNVGGEVLFGVT